METDKIKQRIAFVRAFESGQWTKSELCERFGIARPTADACLRRYAEGGEDALADRSREPKTCPWRTPSDVEERILALRKEYGWGAKKLLQILRDRYPNRTWPARSTVNAILDRHGKLKKQRRHRRWNHPGVAPLETERPNQVWPADFKGQFKTLNRVYCYPLTVTDHFSRKLLLCRALPSVRTEGTKPAFVALFREAGLPEAIRTDNGSPFASRGIHGLCELNVWWMQLGIVHQRIRPSSPQENGQHERMHWDLKRDTTRPPARTRRGQQLRFNRFQRRYNEERPHEGIGGAFPDDLWTPSPRPYPERLPQPDYPGHLEVRRVSNAGCFRLNAAQPFLSNALSGKYIALEEVGDGLHNIIFYNTLLGRIDERTGLITGI